MLPAVICQNCDCCYARMSRSNNFIPKPFPLPVKGKICTKDFIAAAKDNVTIVEKLEWITSKASSDMNGNIERIQTRFKSDQKKNKTINDMVLSEKEEGRDSATIGVLWLTRALHFVECFLELLFSSKDNPSDDMQNELNHAYSSSLEKYHDGWAKSGLYLACKVCPGRTQFIESLGGVTDLPGFYKKLSAFLQTLKTNREIIQDILNDHY